MYAFVQLGNILPVFVQKILGNLSWFYSQTGPKIQATLTRIVSSKVWTNTNIPNSVA